MGCLSRRGFGLGSLVLLEVRLLSPDVYVVTVSGLHTSSPTVKERKGTHTHGYQGVCGHVLLVITVSLKWINWTSKKLFMQWTTFMSWFGVLDALSWVSCRRRITITHPLVHSGHQPIRMKTLVS